MRFETDPEFHFDFFLAERLRMSLGQVRALPAREYLEWGVYFGRKAQAQELEAKRHG